METKEKFLVTIEFRYCDAPKYDDDNYRNISKTLTIGVFETREEANINGNNALEILEKHFKLNPNCNKKERFSNHGGCFGSPNDLITDLAYLQTPFSFYAKITKLKIDDVEQTILSVLDAIKRFRKYKERKYNC